MHQLRPMGRPYSKLKKLLAYCFPGHQSLCGEVMPLFNLIPNIPCRKCGAKLAGKTPNCYPKCNPKRLPPWERPVGKLGDCGTVNCLWCMRHPYGGGG